MKHFLARLARNTLLFFVSAALGVAGYGVVSLLTSCQDSAPSIDAGTFLENRAATRVTTFDGKLTRIARTGSPVDLDSDAMGVTYVLEKFGDLKRIGLNADGQSEVGTFARLKTSATDSDLGFSAIAFHPQFLMTDADGFGCFYVVAAEKASSGEADFTPDFGGETEHHQDVVYEFRTNSPFELKFAGDKREVIRFSQPGAENNLQSIAFDAQGFLYLAVGDGANGGTGEKSVSKNASSLQSAYGKVLRIDPTKRDSTNKQYGIPERNPFSLAPHALAELWAYGLRAPHSLTFDPFSNSICIAEEGLDGTSEINLCTEGAEHFGWDICEGSFLYPPKNGNRIIDGLTPPAVEFSPDSSEKTHTGSFIYRGERFPTLVGKLVFASSNGQLMAASTEEDENGKEIPLQILDHGSEIDKEIKALRPGAFGEIFVLCADGDVFEIHKTVTAANHRKSRRPLVCAVMF